MTVQLGASIATAVYTLAVTWVILKVVDATIGLRVSDQDETTGLDLAQHDEVGYRL